MEQAHRSSGAGSRPTPTVVTAAALWAVAVSAALALWLTFGSRDFSAVAAAILLAPCLGALIAYLRPQSVLALAVALLLVTGAIVLLLIGYTGLLYVPTWLLLVRAMVSVATRRTREP